MEVVSSLIASDSLLQKLMRFFCVHRAKLAYDPSLAQHSGEFFSRSILARMFVISLLNFHRSRLFIPRIPSRLSTIEHSRGLAYIGLEVHL